LENALGARKQMHSLEEALELLLKSVEPVKDVKSVPLANAVGSFLAEDVVSPNALPLFDNSAMDGWAVRSADVQNASLDHPAVLRSIANIPAGQAFDGNIGPGECARIFTGSPLPAGSDAVVMQEDARAELPNVQIHGSVKPWENIRFRGEDVKQGALIARVGERISTLIAALLSACGVAEAKINRKVRVAILATGNELKNPGDRLSPGEIYESNRVLISTLAREIGVEPIIHEIIPDNLDATVATIRAATESHAIITCGGVSVGEYDFVKAAVSELGGTIDFWRVAIKPGKPFAHARVLGKPLFGLPGNPVSALVTFWLLVRPALLKMAGASVLSPLTSFGILTEEISNPGDRRHFVRITVDAAGKVRVSGPQASHRLASLAAANGLVDVPAGGKWDAGKLVSVIRLD
jgi:molybdopterin molybdotransferase